MLGEVIIGKGKYNFEVGENVPFQFIIHNDTDDDLILYEIENAFPYGFSLQKFDKGRYITTENKIILENIRLKSGETITFFAETVANKSVYNFKFLPTAVWGFVGSSKKEKIPLQTHIYSISEVISTVSYQTELREMKEVLRKKEWTLSKHLINLGIASSALRKTLKQALPVNFAFNTHYVGDANGDDESSAVAHVTDVDTLVEYLDRKEEYTVTFITGPKLSGKTIFTATLLYKLWSVGLRSDNARASGKYVVSLSLNGRKESISSIINDAISNSEELSDCNTLEDALDLCEDEEKILELWIDADYYKHEKPLYQLYSWLSEVEKLLETNRLRVFIVIRDTLLSYLLNKLKDTPYNIVAVVPLDKQQAVKIAAEKLGLSEKDKPSQSHVRKLLERIIIRKDKLNLFTKPPYLHYLIDTIDKYQKGRLELGHDMEFLEEKLIITAIDELHKKLIHHPDIAFLHYAKNIHKKLHIENSKKENPTLFRGSLDIHAIDIETEFIIPRSIEIAARLKVNDVNTKILFIGGNSGTGKTVLALKLSYELWKQGYSVVYLSTGDVIGKNIEDLLTVLHNTKNDVAVLLDDSHLDPDRKLLAEIYRISPAKIIATERCSPNESILQSIRKEYEKIKNTFTRKVAGKSQDYIETLANLIDQNKIAELILGKPDFEAFVRQLLKFLSEKNIVTFDPNDDLDELTKKLIEKTEETITLLSFVVQHYIRNKSTKKLSIKSLELLKLREPFENHLDLIADGMCDWLKAQYHTPTDKKIAKAIINNLFFHLSIFSQYEIFVPLDFLRTITIQSLDLNVSYHSISTLVSDAIAYLETFKEIFAKPCIYKIYTNDTDVVNNVCYALPHATFAKYFFDYYFGQKSEKEAKHVQRQMFVSLLLHKDSNLGEITGKLKSYNRSLLVEILNYIIEKDTYRERFRNKLLHTDVRDIGLFLQNLGLLIFFGSAVLGKVVEMYKNTLFEKGEELKSELTNFTDIAVFINGIAMGSKDVACRIVMTQKDVLIAKDLKDTSIRDIAAFIGAIIPRCKEVAREIVKGHKDAISMKISNARITDVLEFIGTLVMRDINMAKEIVETHKDALISKDLRDVSIKDIVTFIMDVAFISEEVARDIVETQKNVIGDKTSNLHITEAGELISIVARVSEEVARDIVETQKNVIGDKIRKASISDVTKFIWDIESDSEVIAKEIVEAHRDVLIAKELKSESITEIGEFIIDVVWISEEIARKIVDTQKDVLIAKDLRDASIRDVTTFIEAVAMASKEVARQFIIAHNEIIKKKIKTTFRKVLVRKYGRKKVFPNASDSKALGYVIRVVAEVDGRLGLEIITEHTEEIKKLLNLVDNKTLADFLAILNFDGSWMKKVIGVVRDAFRNKLEIMRIADFAEFIYNMSCLDRNNVRTEIVTFSKINIGSVRKTIFFRTEEDIQFTLFLIDKFSSVIKAKLEKADEASLKALYERLSGVDERIKQKIKSMLDT